jgi:hypothetical protein
MEICKENLLKELQSIKHCLDMTNTNIEHQHTHEYIVSALEKRIIDLEQNVLMKALLFSEAFFHSSIA